MGVLIIGIGGYFFYQKKSHPNDAITYFIPDNTLLLLETNEISVKKNTTIPRIPLLSRATQQFQIFKKIGFTDTDIRNLLVKKTIYFAVIPEGKDGFSFVNYLPLTPDNQDFIEKLESLNQNTTGYRVIPHTTKGFKILEVINSNSKMVFSYIIQQNLLIFSTSNLAMEEVVLHQDKDWIKSLKLHSNHSENDTLFTFTHFNYFSISKFLIDIEVKKSSAITEIFPLFPESFKWLKPYQNKLEAVAVNNEQHLFDGQKQSKINNLNMIPNSCSYMLDFSYDNPKRLLENFEKSISKNTKIFKLRKIASEKFEFEYKELFDKVLNEITLCTFDNLDQSIDNKVLIIKQRGLLNPLKVIARNVAKNGKEDVFSVQFGSFMIINLGIREFPSLLLGNIFGGFEECYFTEYQDKIILASSLSMMQDYLINIGKGDVWSNSPKHNNILKSCIPSNLTLITDNSKALAGFKKTLNANWVNQIDEYQNELSDVQVEIFQCNATESRMVLLKNIETVKSSKKYSNKWLKLSAISIASGYEPLYLVHPNSKNAEVLVQTKDNILHLISEGKQIWNYQLSGKLVGEIKNSRIFTKPVQQFLCVTNKNIYVLLRQEKGFEVKISKSFKGYNLGNFKIFENEPDNRQFLTIVSEHGESYKVDKETLALNPTNKGHLLSDLILPIPSVIINNQEFAINLSTNGVLSLQNSSGKVSFGFPLNLKGVFKSPPLIVGGENNIVVLSEKGELFNVSLAGKILEKKQLFRPNNEVKFSLIVAERGNDWVIMRTDSKEVMVMDKNEKELFTIEGLIYGKKALNYYNLGVGGRYFAINNGYTTYRFYDELGNSVGGLPIESEYTPTLLYSDSYQKIIMNITTPTTIETWSVKVK